MSQWTRQWWDRNLHRYAVVTSEAVLDELARGDYPHKQEAQNLMAEIPLVPITAAIMEIVDAYVAHKVMPADPRGDALHLAVASFHKADFLLTWNCNHIANPNKFDHIRRVNTILGLFTPELVTPFALLT